MSFEEGKIALTNFRLGETLRGDALELFAAQKANSLDAVKDETSIGWVSGRHLMETKIDEETAIRGGYIYLNMRTAQRKIPGTLLKTLCKREELVYMQANGVNFIPSKIKKEIRNDITEQNLSRMPPSISGVPVVIDRASGMIYLGTNSQAQIDKFVEFFQKTIQQEPIQVNLEDVLVRHLGMKESDLPSMVFANSLPQDEIPAAGRDFLTWLWYYSENDGGKISVDKYGDFELMVEGPLTFAINSEAKGAAFSSVKKGTPTRSAEAKSALHVGKKLKKAKLTIVRGEDVWSGDFDADAFAFSGLSLPDGNELDMHSHFAERIESLHVLQRLLEEYVKIFATHPVDKNEIFEWADGREAF